MKIIEELKKKFSLKEFYLKYIKQEIKRTGFLLNFFEFISEK